MYGNPLKDMKKDSPLYRALSQHGQAEASKAARLLQAALDAQQHLIPKSVAECTSCRSRLENPHAPYVMPALIDDTKI